MYHRKASTLLLLGPSQFTMRIPVRRPARLRIGPITNDFTRKVSKRQTDNTWGEVPQGKSRGGSDDVIKTKGGGQKRWNTLLNEMT